jgi:murein DD-endopeptidase MepM/ murein hydrolase activator NlpD
MDGRSLPPPMPVVNRFIPMKRLNDVQPSVVAVDLRILPPMSKPTFAALSPVALAGIACVLGLCWAAGAQAAKVYRWTDAQGISHYGDRPPDKRQQAQARDVRTIPVRAEPAAVARLRLENRDGHTLAWADNLIDGPIEVMLDAGDAPGVAGAPALPARALVPANGSALVSVLSAVGPGSNRSVELRLQTVPGDPNARPRDVQYLMPLRQPRQRIDQGYGGSFSHNDPQNYYAVDFAAPIGTPVLAARAGTVMEIESDFDKAGLNLEKFGGRANFVRILHDDGTMGLYAHLQENGVLVRVGQRVRAGQQIGSSGNTGFTTGPHLHFVVQVNRGMRLESIPFQMAGPQGALAFGNSR